MNIEMRDELVALRDAVVEHFGFKDSGRMVYYIDELLKRNPDSLKPAIDEIGMMADAAKAPEAVRHKINDLKDRVAAIS